MANLLDSTVLRLERKSTLAAAVFLILLNLESVLETFFKVGLTLKSNAYIGFKS